jgi:hypothetical protein
METIRQTEKKYCSRAMIVSIFIGLALILLGYKPIGKGLLLGTIFSSVNFTIMGATLPLRMRQGRGKSFLGALSSILLRYVLMAVPVFLAIKYDAYNLIAVIFGLFMVQVMILADPLWNSLSLKRTNH